MGWLQFTIAPVDCPGNKRRIVSVAVAGDYWDPATRAEGGAALSMIVAASLKHPNGPFEGLICDLSAVNYSGGDRLLNWRYQLTKATPLLGGIQT